MTVPNPLEADVRETEAIFRRMFDQAAVGVCQLDALTGEVLSVNRKCAEIVGFFEKDLVGRTWMDLTEPENLESELASMQQLIEGKIGSFTTQKQRSRNDGSPVWINLTISPMWQPDRQPTTCIAIVEDITQRKLAEEALLVSEEKFATAFRNSPDAITLTCVADNRIVDANESTCGIIGYSRDELINRTTVELNLWVSRSARDMYIQTLIDHGKIADFEGQFRTKSGEIRHGVISAEMIKLRDGNHILASLRDVTDVKKTEAALKASEKRFRQIVDHAPEALVLLDFESGKFVEVNPAAEQLFRLPKEKLLTLGPVDVSPEMQPNGELSATKCREMLEKTRKGRVPVFEWTHCDADQSPVQCEVRLLKMDIDGRAVVRGSLTNISERKRSQQALFESESLFRSAFEDAAIPTALQDPDGTYVRVNDALCRLLGREREELIGMSYKDITLPADLQQDGDLDRRLLSGKMHFHLGQEKRYFHKNGKQIWGLVSASLVRTSEGTPKYRVVQIQDITERKQAEHALVESEEKLRELNVSLEQRVVERTAELAETNAELVAFAHTVSHDLRAPLRAMEGFAMALAEDYENQIGSQGMEYLQHIVDNAQRMEQLIDDLLTYSRLGRTELRTSPISLQSIVDDALKILDLDPRAAGPDLTIQPNMPAIVGHRSTLVQVASNLISNALKFVPEGKTARVLIRSEKTDNAMVRLWVEDNGIGIHETHQARIFRIFERLHGVESYSGTGIGLAIVARACNRLNGRYGVESVPGKGSRFWVEFPIGGVMETFESEV